MAYRVLPYIYPSPVSLQRIEKWADAGHIHPPYLSSTPFVCHHDLLPGDILIFASDGLADALENANAEEILISLASGSHRNLTPQILGHDYIHPQEGDNVAERVVRNVLFGTDHEKMKEEMSPSLARDDISLVVIEM